MKTFLLAALAFALGLGLTLGVLFNGRFLWVAYGHGGLF